MGEFKLILLSERARPVRNADPSGEFLLIPYRSRAELMAEKLAFDPDNIVEWLSPRDTQDRLNEAISGQVVAQAALLSRVQAGLIKTAAAYSVWENPGKGQSSSRRPILIPAEHWAFFRQLEITDQYAFWDTSDVTFEIGIGGNFEDISVRYFGVRFDPVGIEEMIASAGGVRLAQPTPTGTSAFEQLVKASFSAPTASNKGGRPRKDWWDDLWIEICAYIHEQGIPEKQADIENAMLNWAAENGHELSVSSVRPRARKLIQRLQSERTKT